MIEFICQHHLEKMQKELTKTINWRKSYKNQSQKLSEEKADFLEGKNQITKSACNNEKTQYECLGDKAKTLATKL